MVSNARLGDRRINVAFGADELPDCGEPLGQLMEPDRHMLLVPEEELDVRVDDMPEATGDSVRILQEVVTKLGLDPMAAE